MPAPGGTRWPTTHGIASRTRKWSRSVDGIEPPKSSPPTDPGRAVASRPGAPSVSEAAGARDRPIDRPSLVGPLHLFREHMPEPLCREGVPGRPGPGFLSGGRCVFSRFSRAEPTLSGGGHRRCSAPRSSAQGTPVQAGRPRVSRSGRPRRGHGLRSSAGHPRCWRHEARSRSSSWATSIPRPRSADRSRIRGDTRTPSSRRASNGSSAASLRSCSSRSPRIPSHPGRKNPS